MNNRTYVLLLVFLTALGIFLVYQEAQARPVSCGYAEFWCTYECWGDFSTYDCWEDDGHLYCWFSCTDFGRSCGWFDPVYEICEGPTK